MRGAGVPQPIKISKYIPEMERPNNAIESDNAGNSILGRKFIAS